MMITNPEQSAEIQREVEKVDAMGFTINYLVDGVHGLAETVRNSKDKAERKEALGHMEVVMDSIRSIKKGDSDCALRNLENTEVELRKSIDFFKVDRERWIRENPVEDPKLSGYDEIIERYNREIEEIKANIKKLGGKTVEEMAA
jgi:hypothetical protein